LTTLSKMILGKNSHRRKTRGAFGNPTSEFRKKQMMERYNEEFTKKLEKMRMKNEQKLEKKETNPTEINPLAIPVEIPTEKTPTV